VGGDEADTEDAAAATGIVEDNAGTNDDDDRTTWRRSLTAALNTLVDVVALVPWFLAVAAGLGVAAAALVLCGSLHGLKEYHRSTTSSPSLGSRTSGITHSPTTEPKEEGGLTSPRPVAPLLLLLLLSLNPLEAKIEEGDVGSGLDTRRATTSVSVSKSEMAKAKSSPTT
jgi:hypothetical protein